MIRVLQVAVLALLVASPVLAQDADWRADVEEQVEYFRRGGVPEARLATVRIQGLTPPPVQALLTVGTAPLSPEAQMIDHGMLVADQTVEVGSPVRLLAKAPGVPASVGGVGVLLWPAVERSSGRTVWCRREPDAPPGFTPEYACFGDDDDDGRFERLIRIWALYEGGSAIHIRDAVKSAKSIKPVPYERAEGAAIGPERLVLRYEGPVQGRVRADGIVTDGLVLFTVLVGPSPSRMDRLRTIRAQLGADGRATVATSFGHRIEIVQVTADGRARVRLTAAPAAGELLLYRVTP